MIGILPRAKSQRRWLASHHPHTHPRTVGEITMWPTDTAPSGWLLCAGQAVSRSTYSGLFGVVGTVFGVGNGSTTFNLPDMRGRLPLGQDDMGGSSANRVTAAAADSIGGSGGAETHTLATTEIPAHNHGFIGQMVGDQILLSMFLVIRLRRLTLPLPAQLAAAHLTTICRLIWR